MTNTEIITSIIAIISSIGAALAWIAKLRWSKEFASAKDETINTLKTQLVSKDEHLTQQIAIKDEIIKQRDNTIAELRELSPPKLREYYLSVTTQLGEYNDKLREEIESLNQKITEKDKYVEEFSSKNIDDVDTLSELKAEIIVLNKQVTELSIVKEKGEIFKDDLEKELINEKSTDIVKTNNTTKFGMMGAIIGTTLFPGIGTVFGAGIGAAIGLGHSYTLSTFNRKYWSSLNAEEKQKIIELVAGKFDK